MHISNKTETQNQKRLKVPSTCLVGRLPPQYNVRWVGHKGDWKSAYFGLKVDLCLLVYVQIRPTCGYLPRVLIGPLQVLVSVCMHSECAPTSCKYCLIETQVWSYVAIKEQQVVAAATWWPAKNRSNSKSSRSLMVGFTVGVGAAHWQDAPLLLLLHPLINSCELNSIHNK